MGLWSSYMIARNNLLIMTFEAKMAIATSAAVVVQKACLFLNNILDPWVYDQTNSVTATIIYVTISTSLLALLLGTSYVIFVNYYIELKQGAIEKEEETKFTLNDLKMVPKLAWLFMLFIIFIYNTITPPQLNLNSIIQDLYSFSLQQAGDLTSIYPIISLITTVIAGAYVTKYHRVVDMLFVAGLACNLIFLSLMMLPKCYQCYGVIFPIAMIGILQGCYLPLFTQIYGNLIQKKLLGMVQGVTMSISNILGLIPPFVFGFVLDHTMVNGEYDYFWIFLIFECLSFMGLLTAVYIYFVNKRAGSPLNAKSPSENEGLWRKTDKVTDSLSSPFLDSVTTTQEEKEKLQ